MCNHSQSGAEGEKVEFSLSAEEQRRLPILEPSRSAMADLVGVFAQLDARHEINLGPLTESERRRFNEPSGGFPRCAKVGIDRQLTPVLHVRGLNQSVGKDFAHGLVEQTDRAVVWTLRITSPGATSLRVLIRDINLPREARAYVTDGQSQVWGPYLPEEDPCWTHSIFGDSIIVQVQVPATGAACQADTFSIPAVAHFEDKSDPEAKAASIHPIERDAASTAERGWDYCRPKNPTEEVEVRFEKASRAIAQLRFGSGGGWYVCTGGLLRDGANSGTPFLLTAHHCFSTQYSAGTLEAIWDWVKPCDGPLPDKANLPRSRRATLLARALTNDFTLVQLMERPPATAHFLRWTRTDISTTPTRLYRLSHPKPDSSPGPLPQKKQISTLRTYEGACGRYYLHHDSIEGGTWNGSSGSPVWRAAGNEPEVVGQLYGWCEEASSHRDGAFYYTYPLVKQFLGELSSEPGGEGPEITFSSVPSVGTAKQKIKIVARVQDPNGVSSVAMFWQNNQRPFACDGTNNQDWWCEKNGDMYTWAILLSNSLADRRFYVVATDSQGNTRVSETKMIRVVKAPEGQILFVSDKDRPGARDIYRINADGTGEERLTNGTANEHNYSPAWSPDGSFIVFLSDRSGNPELFIMNSEGGDQRPVVAHRISATDQPVWGGSHRSVHSSTGV